MILSLGEIIFIKAIADVIEDNLFYFLMVLRNRHTTQLSQTIKEKGNSSARGWGVET